MKLVLSIKQEPECILRTYCSGYLLLLSLNVTLSNIESISSIWSPIYLILLAGLILIGLYGLNRAGRLFVFILLELIVLILFGLTYLRQTVLDMPQFIDSIKITCISSIPFACCLHEIKNRAELLESMYKISIIAHVFIYLGVVFYTNTTYSMALGYSLLPHTLILIDYYFERKRAYNLVMAIIDTIYIVIFCSRGPLVSIGVFVLLRLVLSKDITKRTKIISLLFVASIVVIVVFFWSDVLNLIEDIACSIGVNSRTINLIRNNSFLYHDSGRLDLISATKELISQKPLLGWGLGGGWSLSYPHNIFYESILSFGYVVGIIIIGLMLYKWIKIIKTHDYSYQRLGFILGANVLTLLFSSSMIRSYTFLAFLVF